METALALLIIISFSAVALACIIAFVYYRAQKSPYHIPKRRDSKNCCPSDVLEDICLFSVLDDD